MVYVTLGDTIRLNGAFEAFDGTGTDPTTVTLKVYDHMKNTLVSATTTSDVTNGSTDGAFYYDYKPLIEGTHFYEFEGTLEGHTISDKGTFYVTWA